MNREDFTRIAKEQAEAAYPSHLWPGMSSEGKLLKYLSENVDGRRMTELADDLEPGVEPVSKAVEGPLGPREEQAAKLAAMADSIAGQMRISKSEAYGVIAESPLGQEEIAKYRGEPAPEPVEKANAPAIRAIVERIGEGEIDLQKGLGILAEL
jgi:hypothetical protein